MFKPTVTHSTETELRSEAETRGGLADRPCSVSRLPDLQLLCPLTYQAARRGTATGLLRQDKSGVRVPGRSCATHGSNQLTVATALVY